MGLIANVRSFMTRDIISVKTTDLVREAVDVMVRNDIGAVVVTEDGKPVGILTERDVLKNTCFNESCGRVGVESIMSKPLITIDADSSLGEAASLMMKRNIRRLLVEEKGKIIGIITQKDVINGTLEIFMLLASL